MKGVAIQTTVALVVGIVVVGVALYFLTFLFNFDALFLSSNQKVLSSYSTCALALCAYGYDRNGNPSSEVNQVGCLKREGGDCVLSCAQTRAIIQERGYDGELRGDSTVFCGEESKLDFEFSDLELGPGVPLRSGQMDRISRPEWLCKPWRPLGFSPDDFFGNPPGLTTADFLYHGTDSCIMLAKLSEVPITTIQNLFLPEGERVAGGCFTGVVFSEEGGIEDLYTPILEYSIEDQKVHPSGIYLDVNDHFTDTAFFNNPECKLENPRQQEYVVTDEEIRNLAKKYEDAEFDQIVPGTCDSSGNNCEVIKVPFNELSPKEQAKVARNILKEEYEDITFVDDIKNCPSGRRCEQFESTKIPENSLGDRISQCDFQIRYKDEKITYSVYAEDTLPTPFALFGSCKTVTLDRDIGAPRATTPTESIVPNESPKETQEPLSVTISIDKNEYEVGETVKLVGQVAGDSDSKKRFSSKKAEVLYYNKRLTGVFAVPYTDRVVVIDRKFESEYTIDGEILRGATFEVFTEYNDVKSNVVEFSIK